MASRLARLFPVYLVVVAATLLATAYTVAKGQQSGFLTHFADLSPTGAAMVAISNVTMVGQDFMSFSVIGADGIPWITAHPLDSAARGENLLLIPPAWSLSVELFFYVCAPVLLRLSTRTLVGIGLASLAVRIVLQFAGLDYDPWTYRFFPSELIFFLAGAVAFRLLTVKATKQSAWTGPALLGCLVVVAVIYWWIAHVPGVEFATPLLFALAVPRLFAWTSHNKIDRWVGELSYPLYVVHLLVAKVLDSFRLPITGVTLTLASLVAAAVLLLLVDLPTERVRQRKLDRILRDTPILPDPIVEGSR